MRAPYNLSLRAEERSDGASQSRFSSTRMRYYCVYILTNERQTVLYIGVTGNLTRRIIQHKEKLVKGFTSKYNVTKLVHTETFDDIGCAIEREKQLKKWSRSRKDKLIAERNPDWEELDVVI
jgi:putative endonuclease